MTKIQEDIDSMKMSAFGILLYPFAVIYGIIMALRNYGYDKGYKKSYQFVLPIISVGNLSVGGTGKTPAVEYLIRLLKDRHKLTILSRGYGRKTKGILFAGEGVSDASKLGDEPYQLYRKYGSCANVVVAENRVEATRAIMAKFPTTEVMVLDDAYQHRQVTPQLNILLTDFEKPFYEDYILPAGRLREARTGAVRAHIIVVTKCSYKLSDEQKKIIKNRIIEYAGEKPVFFSHIQYGALQPFWKSAPMNKRKVVALSGIAKPDLFEKYLKTHFEIVKHFRYPDHYIYTTRTISRIKQYFQGDRGLTALLTTEKDMVKLLDPKFGSILTGLPCYYLPIEMVFDERGSEFDELVLQATQTMEKITYS